MAWTSWHVDPFACAAFWVLAVLVPWGHRIGLCLRTPGQGGCDLRWTDSVVIVACDVCAAALVVWTWLVIGAVLPWGETLGIGTCIVWGAAVSYIDVVLFTDMGARLDIELLGYTSNLNKIGGSRWRRPLAMATAWAILAVVASYALVPAVKAWPALYLFGLSCGVLPLFAWEKRCGSKTHLWRMHGVTWRWVHIGLAAVLQALRPRVFRAESPVESCCIPPQEQFTRLHPSYPLWRTTQAWGGSRHLPFQMAKGHRPHVIYIVMESMGAMNTGCIGAVPDATPCFDAWSLRGALFAKHYVPGHSTSRSILSALYGVLPGLRSRPTLNTERPAYLHGLPQILGRVGYRSIYMQGATLSFDNKDDYFKTRGFDEVLGCEALLARYPDAELGAWEAPHDQYLFDAHLDWLQAQHSRGQPTFTTLLTISNHDPWEIPKAYRPEDLLDDAAYAACMTSQDPVVIRRRSALTLRYADAQLGRYLDVLAQTGILQDSIVFISGDTGQQQEMHQTVPQIGGFLRDAAYHVPMLLLAPRFVAKPKRFEHITSQIDLVPTIMDALGLEGPHHSMGQSLVRIPQYDVAHFTQPHQPAHLSVRQGDWRLNTSVDGKQVALYHLPDDRQEVDNLAAANPEQVRHMLTKIFMTQPWVMRLHQQDAFCPKPGTTDVLTTPLLREAVYAFAPHGFQFPNTLAEIEAWLQTPNDAESKDLSALRRFVARILRTDLAPQEALSLVQLRIRLLYPDSFGELDWIEDEQYLYLAGRFNAAEIERDQALLAQVQRALGKPDVS